MLQFLKKLKRLGSEVVWYDSVTKSGKLDWQNALTPSNLEYFRACPDGIFLNYNWNEKLLSDSQSLYVKPFLTDCK